MPLFDTYVAVDWSARAAPATGADSIWIATLDRVKPTTVDLNNPPTRNTAAAGLTSILAARPDARVLIGIDVSLGYPAGTAALLGVARAGVPPWAAMWQAITRRLVDDDRNRNNRFDVAASLNRQAGEAAGPFWGCPPGRRLECLAPTKPARSSLGEFRTTERALRAAGRAPMSTWQLTGSGSVGSQTLTALPVLHRLIDTLGERGQVWPFTAGLVAPSTRPGTVVIAEIWPTLFDPAYPAGMIRDAAQVAHVVRCLASADSDATIGAWFTPTIDANGRVAVVAEEGWVLGPTG